MTLIQQQTQSSKIANKPRIKKNIHAVHKQSNKPDPITNLVENVASSYLNAIKKKKGGIVLLQKVAANMECSGHSETKNANYKVLVVLQNTMHVGFPKGTMESFETFEQTAEREFAEETGVNIDEMKKRSKLVNIIKSEKTQMFVYLLNDNVDRDELKIEPVTKDEILHAFWVDIDLLEDMPKTTLDHKYKKSSLTISVIKELRKMIARKLL